MLYYSNRPVIKPPVAIAAVCSKVAVLLFFIDTNVLGFYI